MLSACTTCGCHMRATDASCPHCGVLVAPRGRARTAAAALLGLALGGCITEDHALYGVAVTAEDTDEDGWFLEDGDCDDTDPDIHPDADETAGDGVDSNCDGEDDT